MEDEILENVYKMRSKKHAKQKNEYINKLPEDAMQFWEYDGIRLYRYYYGYCDEIIYLRIYENKYKIIKPYLNGDVPYITLTDINDKQHKKKYSTLIKHLNEELC